MVQNVLESFTTSMDNINKGNRRKKKLKLDTVIRLQAKKRETKPLLLLFRARR